MQASPRSKAFLEYVRDRHEVVELLQAAPSDAEQMQSRKKRELSNAIYRASVVLLSSHLERYIESLIVESIDAINFTKPNVDRIPEALRLTQIEQSIRSVRISMTGGSDTDQMIAKKDMIKKAEAFRSFLDECDRFFTDGLQCDKIDGSILIDSFANPSPEKINRIFRHFGIANIVSRSIVQDGKNDRSMIEGMVQELVNKRNAIAHTGMTADLTRENVINYLRCSRRLIRGIDDIFGKSIEQIIDRWPWHIAELSSAP